MAGAGKRKATADDEKESMNKRTRITRSMTTDAPRRATFATAELLEHIFMGLPLKDAFVAQMVCRQFRDIVATSVQLQKKLFLRPSSDSSSENWTVLRRTTASSVWTQSGDDFKFARHFDDDRAGTKSGVWQACGQVTPRMLNPLLDVTKWGGPAKNAAQRMAMRRNVDYAYFTMPLRVAAPGSWRQMQITEPPCLKAELRLTWKKVNTPVARGAIHKFTLQDDEGITLGKLIESALRMSNSETAASVQHYLYISNQRRLLEEGRTIRQGLNELDPTGRLTVLDNDFSAIILQNVVCVTEEEWKAVIECKESDDVDEGD